MSEPTDPEPGSRPVPALTVRVRELVAEIETEIGDDGGVTIDEPDDEVTHEENG